MLMPILPYAHRLLQEIIEPGELVIDATCGNGNDTLALSEMTGKDGKVYAFDIQEQAIVQTKKKLESNQVANVELILDGHENVGRYLTDKHKEKVAGAIFNLGYLPRSDKKVITKPTTTIRAIDTIASYLKPAGRIICVVYHGHPGGAEEKQALLNYATTLNQHDFRVLHYGFMNQVNHPPFIIAIEKKDSGN